MRSEFGPRPEETRFAARHILFVEGSSSDVTGPNTGRTKQRPVGIDIATLGTLLGDLINVEPLGSASGIAGAARALCESHPTYYFLIDRDHRPDEDVERTWRHFPDPGQSNLLIWRRRELENYFLIPDYLSRSQFIHNCTPAELMECIRLAAEERIFLDAANSVIIEIREELKKMDIPLLKRAAGCIDHKTALDHLLRKPQFKKHAGKAKSLSSSDGIRRLYEATVTDLLGGEEKPRWGTGRWLELFNGKEVLNVVVDKCLLVEDTEGKKLQGKVKLNEIVKDLLRRPLEEQPDDFQQLYRLILEHVRKAA